MSPWDRSLYPDNWAEITLSIRERAGGRCECQGECGLHTTTGRCVERNREPAQFANGRVVLSVAHLDHDPQNSDPANLRAMCARCHLRYDVEHHKATAARTRDRKRKQGRLFP